MLFPLSGSISCWLECTLKEIILKHFDERQMLLRILLDESLAELIEVADLMARDEQHKRLVELQNKQRWLLIEDSGRAIQLHVLNSLLS